MRFHGAGPPLPGQNIPTDSRHLIESVSSAPSHSGQLAIFTKAASLAGIPIGNIRRFAVRKGNIIEDATSPAVRYLTLTPDP
jgi:hypothetical protein